MKITTKIKIFQQVTFPTVTICNQNRVHCENLKYVLEDCKKTGSTCNERDVQILSTFFEYCTNGMSSGGNTNQNGGSTDQNSGSTNQNDGNTDQNSGSTNQNGGTGRKKRAAGQPNSNDQSQPPEGSISANTEAEKEFLKQYMTLPSSIRMEIGHNFTNFIQECTYKGRDYTNSRCQKGVKEEKNCQRLGHIFLV